MVKVLILVIKDGKTRKKFRRKSNEGKERKGKEKF